jgi:hypothetical protein
LRLQSIKELQKLQAARPQPQSQPQPPAPQPTETEPPTSPIGFVPQTYVSEPPASPVVAPAVLPPVSLCPNRSAKI